MTRGRASFRFCPTVVATLAFLVSSMVSAQIPQLLNYQGYLSDDAGSPLNGLQSITFSIHSAAEGGTQLWTETQNVMVSNGLFTVLLGTVTLIPIGVFQGDQQYLAVRIGAGPELSPRQRLVSVGHCFKAREAERLDGRAASAYVRSVDGVAPQNGNVDLVAGTNVTLTPNAQAGSVTIASSALTLPFTSSVSSSQTALAVVNSGAGYGLSASSTTYGVRATSSGASGYGVYGIANGENGRGIVGSTTGANGYGVWGSSSSHYGVYGSSTTGTGVYGKETRHGNFGFLGGQGYGVYGENGETGSIGFLASNYYGVYAENPQEATSGALAGPDGARGASRDGFGVLGTSTDSDGVRGHSTNGYGVRGITDEFAPDLAGVFGTSTGSDGVRGDSTSGYGVHGITGSAARAGVFGVGAGAGAGVLGRNDNGRGVHGQSLHGSAVYAEGDLAVTGAYKGNIRSESGGDGAPFPRPAFDSGWRDLHESGALVRHEIGGDPDDYLVDLQFQSNSLGQTNRGVGGDSRSVTQGYGAYWYDLTDETIYVRPMLDDDVVNNFRIRIWVIR